MEQTSMKEEVESIEAREKIVEEGPKSKSQIFEQEPIKNLSQDNAQLNQQILPSPSMSKPETVI